MPRTPNHTPPDLAEVTVPVEALADWLVLTATRVQQLAKKNIVIKDEHGVYRLKASVQGYIREMNAKADGKNSDWHKARTKKEKAKADLAEIEKYRELGKLVNADKFEKALERAKSSDRQRWIMLRKLAPQLEGKTAQEIDIELENYGRESLAQLAALTLGGGSGDAGLPDHGAAAGPADEPVGGQKAEVKQ